MNRISLMAVLLTLPLCGQTNVSKPTHKSSVPPPPKTADELRADLVAALQEPVFAKDQFNFAIDGHTITLTGVVHNAEHKGLATRLARLVATHDGWTDFHVLNQTEVQLP